MTRKNEMVSRQWKDTEQGCFYYFNESNGKVVGQAHNISHTKIWVAKIPISHNEEAYLGQFIDANFAKRSIEEYWQIQDRTLLE